MKQKVIVLIILILIGTSSSFAILRGDSYSNNESNKDSKVLAFEQSMVGQVALAKETATKKQTTKKPAIKNKNTSKKKITKKPTTSKKKTTKKKTTKRKVTKKKKKSKVNLAPPVITPSTAPHSAKNKYN